jgi:hypothetical protein
VRCDQIITVMRPSVRWPDVLNASFERCVLPYQHPGRCSNRRCPATTGGGGAVWWCNMAHDHSGDHIGERVDLVSPVTTGFTEEKS